MLPVDSILRAFQIEDSYLEIEKTTSKSDSKKNFLITHKKFKKAEKTFGYSYIKRVRFKPGYSIL